MILDEEEELEKEKQWVAEHSTAHKPERVLSITSNHDDTVVAPGKLPEEMVGLLVTNCYCLQNLIKPFFCHSMHTCVDIIIILGYP